MSFTIEMEDITQRKHSEASEFHSSLIYNNILIINFHKSHDFWNRARKKKEVLQINVEMVLVWFIIATCTDSENFVCYAVQSYNVRAQSSTTGSAKRRINTWVQNIMVQYYGITVIECRYKELQCWQWDRLGSGLSNFKKFPSWIPLCILHLWGTNS